MLLRGSEAKCIKRIGGSINSIIIIKCCYGTLVCLSVSNTIHIGIQCGGFQYKSATLLCIVDANDATWIQDLIAVNEIGSFRLGKTSCTLVTTFSKDYKFVYCLYLFVVVLLLFVCCICCCGCCGGVWKMPSLWRFWGQLSFRFVSFRMGLLTEYWSTRIIIEPSTQYIKQERISKLSRISA